MLIKDWHDKYIMCPFKQPKLVTKCVVIKCISLKIKNVQGQ